jgi:hypothetical protein
MLKLYDIINFSTFGMDLASPQPQNKVLSTMLDSNDDIIKEAMFNASQQMLINNYAGVKWYAQLLEDFLLNNEIYD